MTVAAAPDVASLALAVGALIEPSQIDSRSLWDALSTATGQHVAGSGHPTAKSRPPATLAGVALVIDITTAAREGADDLAGRIYANVPSNLYAIVDALSISPDDDLISWWTDASNEWATRARSILGQSSELTISLHGARCPYCGAVSVRQRQGGEWWVIPAIHIEWDITQTVADYQVNSIVCRSCDARWLRGPELDRLAADALARNYESPQSH